MARSSAALSPARDYRATDGDKERATGPKRRHGGAGPAPLGSSELPRDPRSAREWRRRRRLRAGAAPTAPRWGPTPSRGQPPGPAATYPSPAPPAPLHRPPPPPPSAPLAGPRRPRNHPDNAPLAGRIRLRLPGTSLPPGAWSLRAGARGGPEAGSAPGSAGGRRLRRRAGGCGSTCSPRPDETVGGLGLRGEGRRPRGPAQEAGAQTVSRGGGGVADARVSTMRAPPWAYPRKEEAVHSDLVRTMESGMGSWTEEDRFFSVLKQKGPLPLGKPRRWATRDWASALLQVGDGAVTFPEPSGELCP